MKLFTPQKAGWRLPHVPALCVLFMLCAAPAFAQMGMRELGLRVMAGGSSAIQVMGNTTGIQVWVYKATPSDTDVADQGGHWFRAEHVRSLGHDHLYNVPGLKKQYLLRITNTVHNRVHGMSVFTRDITPTMPVCGLVAGTYTVVATGAPIPNTPARPVFVQMGNHVPKGLYGSLMNAQHAIEGTRPPATVEVTPGANWETDSTATPPPSGGGEGGEHFPADAPPEPGNETLPIPEEPQNGGTGDEFGGGGGGEW